MRLVAPIAVALVAALVPASARGSYVANDLDGRLFDTDTNDTVGQPQSQGPRTITAARTPWPPATSLPSTGTNIGKTQVGNTPVPPKPSTPHRISTRLGDQHQSNKVIDTRRPPPRHPPPPTPPGTGGVSQGTTTPPTLSRQLLRQHLLSTGRTIIATVDLTRGPAPPTPSTPLHGDTPSGSAPVSVAFSPDGARAYTANRGSNDVSVIDTATSTTVGSPIDVGRGPRGVVVIERDP